MAQFPCAGIIVFHDNSTIVVRTEPGNCSFPKGKRNANESDLTAAWRELGEETGLTSVDVDLLEGVSFEELSDKGNPSIRYFVGRLKPGSRCRPLVCDPDELAQVEWIKIDTAMELAGLKMARKRILEQARDAYQRLHLTETS